MRALTFCDLASFYCATGGGIRTYCEQKLDWFGRQNRHAYILVVPGRRSATVRLAPAVTLVEVRGIAMGPNADGYRIFLDVAQLAAAVTHCSPDVLEAGDPWVSGPLALMRGLWGRRPHIISSFFHSDPVPTYFEPVLAPPISRALGRAFYRLQRLYDLTLVSSDFLEARLRQEGVTNVRCIPFGVDPVLFKIGCDRVAIGPTRRLLYVGRLDRDKQADLLLAALPRLLEAPDVHVTVAGTGALRSAFERYAHPRFQYVGYVREREAVWALYRQHDILLATCAYETFGLAALEAAAAGLVVVGPDLGGTGDLLRQITSPFAFRAGDAEAFLAAVRAAIRTDCLSASARSRTLAARYGTWSDAVERLVAVYERAIEECPD
jgi:glycosyltransferase involved in cell wall biosynthesis